MIFPLLKGEGFLEVWKSESCIGKFPQCVRYQMFLRKEKVPDDLLPNGTALPRT